MEQKKKVSDYIAEKLVKSGIRHVFMVTGGAAMHLNQSFGTRPGLKAVFNHHEQACAIAAESYARLTRKIAAVCVTSGPGGTNAITGVLGAWLDSIPMLVISGQVRYDTTVRSTGLNLRQLGDQEYDITRSIAPMAKYAVMVTDPYEIRYHLERALYLAKAGRPGPCWIDIPVSVQGAYVRESELKTYDSDEDDSEIPPRIDRVAAQKVIKHIKRSERPVLLAGSAIRSSGSHKAFLKLTELLRIPVVTAWNAHDCVTDAHPFYFGRPGSIGDRAGNFIVQNSDLLLVLGCRLNVRQISYNWQSFARKAFKIIIDIDPLELEKPTIRPDLAICGNVRDLIKAMLRELPAKGLPINRKWLEWCRARKERFPVVQATYWNRSEMVNPYCFVDRLTKLLPENQIVITGNGSACVCTFQGAVVKKGQRFYTNSGSAPMGYDLPAAIGACFGSNNKKIVCIAGDGSIQMNLQELQTIVHHRLPIKIFVLNNNGYHSIRQTMGAFFGTAKVGYDPESGVSFPDMERIAYAYEIPFLRCRNHGELDKCISQTLWGRSPFMCEIMVWVDQPFAPKQSSQSLPDGRIVSKPLEDLAPFLDRKEFLENMLIDPISE
jgi:acetolactate synthase-1/2/3 large subunit